MINQRLLKICKQIQDAKCVVDVGCDHAFLSIYLLENHRAQHVINIDKNLKPLRSGKQNLQKANLAEKSTFILNDGLKGLSYPEPIDAIVIAGMGATNILDIIQNHHLLVKKYYLQANNDWPLLRQGLKKLNYQINQEWFIIEDQYPYIIMEVDPNQSTNLMTNRDIYVGPILQDTNDTKIYDYYHDRMNHLLTFSHYNVREEIKQELKEIKEWLQCKS